MTGNTGAASVVGARSSGRRDRTYRREGETASITDDFGWEERCGHTGCSVGGGGRRPDGKRQGRKEVTSGRAPAAGAELVWPAWGPPQNSEVSGAVAHIRAY